MIENNPEFDPAMMSAAIYLRTLHILATWDSTLNGERAIDSMMNAAVSDAVLDISGDLLSIVRVLRGRDHQPTAHATSRVAR